MITALKRIISFCMVAVMLLGVMPMTAFATEAEENPWRGRSAVFVGDSITAGSGTTKKYFEYLAQMLELGSVNGMGIGGSCISNGSDYGNKNTPLINRYKDIPSADLIQIFMGTNDYGHATPIGSPEDVQAGTFYGALNTIIPYLQETHKESKIVFVTPLHRHAKSTGTTSKSEYDPNASGHTLHDYVEAIKQVCATHGVSVIDLYTESEMDPRLDPKNTAYFPDGLHPNAAGHELIAKIMESHIREYEPVKIEPIVQTELIQGNKFSASNNQPCRASSRVNYYLKAGTVITLRDPDVMQWSCAKTNGEISSTNLGYFPDSQWTDKETAVVAEDGWVGFVFKYRDETKGFDLTKPLSDFITIEEPHTHTYENGSCIGCEEKDPNKLELNGLNVLCLGDSITAGQGLTTDTRWTNVLASKYGWHLTNKSQGGISLSSYYYTANGKSDVSIAKKAEILKTMTTKPDVIIVWGGHNDTGYRYSPLGTWDDETTDSFKGALKYIAELADEYAPDATLFVLTPLWTTEAPSTLKVPENTTDNNWMFVDAIYEGAEAYGWIPVNMDLCGITPFTKSGLLLDNIHPNEAGTEKIVEYLSEELASYGENSKKETVVLNQSSVSLEVGKKTTVKAVLTPRSGYNTPVFIWSSSNSSVATVDANGKITAVAHGNATITATADNDVSATVQVSVAEGEHTYESTVTAPTCTEQGYTTYTCDCGDSYVDDYVDAADHNYAEGTCTVCGEADPDYSEPAWGTWVAFGTSITEDKDYMRPNATNIMGTYIPYLSELMGVDAPDANYSIGGAAFSTHLLMYIYYAKYQKNGLTYNGYTHTAIKNADLITIEGGVNDFYGSVPLGKVGDTVPYSKADPISVNPNSTNNFGGTTDGTFAGCIYAAITELRRVAPDATIVFITDNAGTGSCAATKANALGHYLHDYNDMMTAVAESMGCYVIDAGRTAGFEENLETYLSDHIHQSEAGGEAYANAIWRGLCAIRNGEQPESGHTHRYTESVTAPTCTEKGYTTYTCDCGDSYVDDYVDATGNHTYSNGICTGCGAKIPNSISLRYDDHYDVSGKTVEIVDAGTPTSFKVGYGVAAGTRDDAVITLVEDKLIATGIGTAKVRIDGVFYEITVEAAPISLILLAGQSNMRGSEGNANQSIICPEGMVYATYGDDRGSDNTAMTVNNATMFAPSALTGAYSSINVNGTTDCLSGYPVYSLTEAGAGKIGPDSGFAYEWVKQTGEKVWIVNAAHGGTSISVWQPGTTEYEQCQALFTACQQTLQKEIAAGHYTLSHMGYFWCQGCSDRAQSAEWYVKKYLAMHEGFKDELAFDHDSDPATADKTFEFGGIIPVRVGSTATSYRDGSYTVSNPYAYHESFVDLRMSGPRVAQYWMGNNPELYDIHVVCTIGDDWVWMPDGTNGVAAYFNAHYPNGRVDYTVQVTQKDAWYTPTTPKAVHDSIHYNQIGYNEIGRESVRNMLYILGIKQAPEMETTVNFVGWDGYSEIDSITAATIGASGTLVVPMVYPIWAAKDITYTLGQGLTWNYYDLLADHAQVESSLSVDGNTQKSVTVNKAEPGELYKDHLSKIPENVCSGLNLWNVLEHDEYYFASGTNWGKHSSGNVYSVTIPVRAGERIFATAWGKAGENGHASSNGIRVTFFSAYGVAKTMTPAECYAEFSKNGGYLVAPENAVAINIAMWNNSDINEIYILNREHAYENGICTGCGAANSPYLQQLPENVIGCTNLYDILAPMKGYYTATKYDTSNGAVLSVVIPVKPGDRIAASSFGSVSENMGSVNGIRVTYLLGDKIVTSLSPSEVYNGYTSNGYITVPDGVDAVCIPWWKPSDNNWLNLMQISKDYAVHSPKSVPAQAPSCTETGYTAGEICEVCQDSLSGRDLIPATGHMYSGDTCTVCGALNIAAILGGKNVSILGDSISTFNGYSNDATVNTTIGGNGPRYDAGTADTKPGSYCLLESVDQTWWMHFANRSGMKVLVNNSWAGSQVFGGQTSDGRVIPAAYLDRCVNLHDNTLENNPENAPIYPDVIFVYLGINDYNFNRSKVGTGAIDYSSLVRDDGTYVTPTTFGEAYGILLHKMRNAYPKAQIFAMTLLPENLYSVDRTAWEQHNAYIRAAAEYYGLPLVDLAENCAITWENYSGYMIDKIHPTTAGMKLISDCIEAELTAYYKENPPHTHTYEISATPPTCTEQGYTTHTCHCGDSYVDSYVNALGHSFGAWVVTAKPNCTEKGTERRDCDACDHFETREIKATGHNYDSVVTKPTCTEQGYTTYTCATCGDTYVSDYVAALGHTEVIDSAIKENSARPGWTDGSHCDICGEVITEQIEIPAKGYDWMLDDGEFKLLLIGNSYSQDASSCGQGMKQSQLFDILQAMLGEDVKVTVALLYSGGKGINWHATQADRNKAAYGFSVITSDNPTWKSYGTYTSANALAWTDWDVVSLQTYNPNPKTGQESVPYPDTTDEKFYSLEVASEYMLDHIANNAPYADVYFYMHWAQTSSTMLNAALSNYNKTAAYIPVVMDFAGMQTGNQFTTIIPVGLSIQNARSTYLALLRYNTKAYADGNLNLTTDAQIGLQRDGGHVSFNIGRYIAGLTFAEMIVPESMRAEGYVLPDIRVTESVGKLPKEYTTIAQLSVWAAVNSWKSNGSLAVTEIEGHAEDPTVAAGKLLQGTTVQVPCGAGVEQISTAILAALPADFAVESVTLADGTTVKAGASFTCEATIRFGYTFLTVNVNCVADAHDHVPAVTAPTCTEQGYTTHTCHCGESYVDSFVNALGHSFGSWVVTTKPTCTTTGEERRDCDACDHFETRKIKATGHSYDAVVTKPTCTEKGYTTHTCHCGDSYVDSYVNALGHSFGAWVEVKAPTCEAEGQDKRVCSACGGVQHRDTRISGDPNKIQVSNPVEDGFFEGKVIMAIGDSLTAGTLTTKEERYHYLTAQTLGMTNINSGTSGATLCPGGYLPNKFDTLMTVDLLTKRQVDVVTIFLGVNDWNNGVLNGTYRGVLKYDPEDTWYDLGEFGTDDITTIYGAAKMWCERILELQATEECKDIQFVFMTPVILSRNRSVHTKDDWSQDKTNVFGYSLRQYCTAIMEVCAYYGVPVLDLNMYSGMYYHSETDNNVEHFGGDGIHPGPNGHAMMAAALTEFLREGYTYEKRTLPTCGHSYEKTVTEPSCTESGYTTYRCPDCYFWCTENETPATGHSYNSVVTKPTCTEKGYTTHTCHCGESYVDSYVNALGHSFGAWVVTAKPNCTEKGTERRDCDACNHFETREIKATGHSYDAVVTKPTCTEKGYTTHTCHCGDTYVDTYVNALGHKFGAWVVTTKPTCTKKGTERRDCDACDHFETREIKATGHSYDAVVTKPTCTEKGYTTHTCHCGESYVDSYVNALSHSFGAWVVTAKPNCTEKGTERRDCDACDHFETREIKATGHSYDAVVTAPTCTEQGYTTHTCHCGESYIDSYVNALGHSFGAWVVTTKPTCTKKGTERRDCDTCNHFETREINATGHSYDAVVTKPTCTEKGYTTHTCHCGESYIDSYVNALGHNFGTWVVTTKPTCTTAGEERRDCDACDHFETREIKALGHDTIKHSAQSATCTEIGWDAYESCSRCDYSTYVEIPATGHNYNSVVTKPTCEEEGYTTHTCHCGDSYVDSYVNALGHSFGAWVVTAKPNCTEKGTERRDCDACDHFETREIKAMGHSYDAVVTNPTCTEKGYTTHTCHCGESYVDSYVNALGHSFGAWVVTAKPNCTEKGTERRDCDACDHFETREIKATGHSYDAVVTTPTCTEQGYTTHTCHCGESYVDSFVNALGHGFGTWVVTTKPTCTTTGVERRDCDACNHFETREINATGHSYDAVVTKPTCTEKGYTTHTCHCGESYVDSFVNALGHNFGTWVVTTKSTCTTTGVERRDCDTCDHFETHEIKALGHDTIKHSAQSATCTEIGWNAYETCSRCDYSTYVEIPATGHNYDSVVTKPTCEEKGYTTHTCHCGDSYVDSYVKALGHSFGAWVVTTKPTCTTTGVERRDCDACDHFETREINATGHSYDAVVTKPTCTEKGYTTHTCHCGDSYVDSYVNALGHSYEAEVTEPTCTEYGFTIYTCHCGDNYISSYVSALGHSFDEWKTTTEPTCTKNGEESRECSICAHVETREIKALGHSYNVVVTDPTCTEHGYTTHTCHCGDSYVDGYVKPLGHAYGDWYQTKAPTESESGEKRRDCSHCGGFETSPIAQLGHDHNRWEPIMLEAVAPTCTMTGLTEGSKCSGCGEILVPQEIIHSLGHDFGEWTETKSATCTEDGTERRECNRCDHFETRTIKASGHSYNAVVTHPTCMEKGYTTHTCQCGNSYVDSYVEAAGHTFGKWREIEEATCEQAGKERRDCDACVHFETREIEAVGHNYDVVVTNPTCTEQGYTTHTCLCGESYVDSYVDATGHTFGEWAETEAPSCTEAGEERRECTACDHFETRVVEAMGHSYDAVVTKPTCTEQGYTTHTCHCGDSYVDSYVSALGHSFGSWVVTTKATCSTAGEERRECDACDHFETRIVEATGHSYDSVVTQPTCTEQGYTTHTCECGDSYVDSYVDAAGHTFGDWTETKGPTCTAVGEERRDCDACEQFETREIGKRAHEYHCTVTPPTCTEKGYTTHACHCGESYVDSHVDAIGHVYDNDRDATCNACDFVRKIDTTAVWVISGGALLLLLILGGVVILTKKIRV